MRKIIKILFIFVPPILFILLFNYIFTFDQKLAKTQNNQPTNNSHEFNYFVAEITKVPLNKLYYVLCLENNNVFIYNNRKLNIHDPIFVDIDQKEYLGAMGIVFTKYPNNEIYSKINQTKCIPFDTTKIEQNDSYYKLEIRNPVISLPKIIGLKSTTTQVTLEVSVDQSKLYLRLPISLLILILILIQIAWMNIILLLDKIYKFIKE